jgi:predicted membrane protein
MDITELSILIPLLVILAKPAQPDVENVLAQGHQVVQLAIPISQQVTSITWESIVLFVTMVLALMDNTSIQPFRLMSALLAIFLVPVAAVCPQTVRSVNQFSQSPRFTY